MRILFWSHSFWPAIGGVEIFAAKLLSALRQRGHDVAVITPQRRPEQSCTDQYGGIPIYRFPFQNIDGTAITIDLMAELLQQVAQLKHALAPDVIHLNGVSDFGAFFYLLTAKASPAPLLITLHGTQPVRYDLEKRLIQSADWVAACSAATLAKGRQLVPDIVPCSSVVYNGIETSSVRPGPLPIKTPRVLCLGRLSPEKGFDVALSAFSRVVRRIPQARLVMAGDGPTRDDLERQATALHIRNRVDFIGWIAPDAVPSVLNAATLVVVSSRSEGLPLVALETAQMARPIVATRIEGLPELVVHGVTGLLVDPDDDAGLAEAMTYVLNHPDTATRMGQAARHRVQRLFSWQRQVEAYDALYRRLIADAKRRSKHRNSNGVRDGKAIALETR